MKTINSEYCVKLYDSCEDKYKIYIVMEFCEDNLLTFLKTETKGSGFSEE
jgi:serine/threonine protein kinase